MYFSKICQKELRIAPAAIIHFLSSGVFNPALSTECLSVFRQIAGQIAALQALTFEFEDVGSGGISTAVGVDIVTLALS